MKIILYFRKPNKTNWSVEFIFQSLAKRFQIQAEVLEKVSPFYSTGLLNRLNAVFWAKYECQREKGDINHITGDVHFLTLGLPRWKTILTIHDVSFVKRGPHVNRFILWLFWIYLPVHRSRFVTCVSQETRKDVIRYSCCNPSKIKVIYNFLKKGFVHSPRTFNKKRPILLQIGTNYNKNLERLIVAITGINCELRIIGRIPDKIEKLLKMSRIAFTNKFEISDNDLFTEYINADVITFCSTLEGFGLPIIEAQAVGRVVVTSDVSSMPEIAGGGACLVNPFDISSIRRGIETVVNDDAYRNKLIQKGLENIERFRIDKITQDYLDLYKMVGNGR